MPTKKSLELSPLIKTLSLIVVIIGMAVSAVVWSYTQNDATRAYSDKNDAQILLKVDKNTDGVRSNSEKSVRFEANISSLSDKIDKQDVKLDKQDAKLDKILEKLYSR